MNYEEIVCDANNLYRAYKVSVKSSKWKESTQKFMMNFLRYIFEIQDDLINRTLQNGLALNPSFEEFNTPIQIDQPFKWDDRLYLLPVWSRSDMDELYSNPQMVQAPGY